VSSQSSTEPRGELGVVAIWRSCEGVKLLERRRYGSASIAGMLCYVIEQLPIPARALAGAAIRRAGR
jgi:hypothetical protein